MKVYELAKKMGVQNSDIIDKLKKMGIEVKSHLSVIDEDIVNKIIGNEAKSRKIDKAETLKQEQMHIIRRNVRVINTDGDKKEVEQITTNIAGGVKKTHTVVSQDKDKSNRDRRQNNISNNNYTPRRPKFGGNRNTNIVITRNGKPIEKKEEVAQKVENINTKVEVVEQNKDMQSQSKITYKSSENYRENRDRKDSNYNRNNNSNKNSQNPNYNRNNNNNNPQGRGFNKS